MRVGRAFGLAVLAALVWGVIGGPLPEVASAGPTSASGCILSVPEPDSSAPVPICWTMYRPVGATAEAPVPMIFHSHGWGGSRESRPDAFGDWLDAGFAVISFDQRGFGASGGRAHIEDPDFEGQDVQRLVDLVASFDWVAKDGPDDPVLGAIGGSYGGGYQFAGALTELRDRGATRFDALAPEITWWDLRESLAPNGVVRTVWTLLLYVAGLPSDAHMPVVTASLVEGIATGNFPAALSAFLESNGPAWHVAQGRTLDIPMLLGQGITDNLFPLDQGLQNFQHALTPGARARSIFVGYNGGHVLPSAFPAAISDGSDPCSEQLGGGGFGHLTRRFFTEELLGRDTGLGGRGAYHLATSSGACVTVDSTDADTPVPINDVLSTVGVGLPFAHRIVDGPITVAGTPTLDALVTSLAVEGRAFVGLAVGSDPLSARVVGNNLLPLHEPLPVVAARRSIRLPSVAVDVPAGQTLYLTVTPISDMSIGHGSRLPGILTLDEAVLNLPVVSTAVAPPVVDQVTTTTVDDDTPTSSATSAPDGAAANARPRRVATGDDRPTTTTTTTSEATGDAAAPTAAAEPARRTSDDTENEDVPIGLVLLAVVVLGSAAAFALRAARARTT